MGRDHDRSSYPTVVIVTRLHVTILKYTRHTSFSSHGSPYDLLHSPLAHVCTLSSLHMSARRDARTDGIDQPGAQGDYQRDTAFVTDYRASGTTPTERNTVSLGMQHTMIETWCITIHPPNAECAIRCMGGGRKCMRMCEATSSQQHFHSGGCTVVRSHQRATQVCV